MFLSRIVTVLPRRAMSSVSKAPPTSSEPKNNETRVTKKEQTNDFINYSNRPGYKDDENSWQEYFNPLLTPPPRSPSSPGDFMNPSRLGHWRPFGFDYSNPIADKYYYHEFLFILLVGGGLTLWLWTYGPDYKYREWARREAFLRTAKREALGLPLIDKDVVDPERVVLPTEEEIGDFSIVM